MCKKEKGREFGYDHLVAAGGVIATWATADDQSPSMKIYFY